MDEKAHIKTVIICGIDSSGKTTSISHLPWKNTIKYPNNPEIKDQINSLYKVLTEGNRELHTDTIRNIYRSIHDLYDKDLKINIDLDSVIKEDLPLLIFDRYFIDNVVYSRINKIEKESYSEGHQFIPDLVIMIKVRDYKLWKEKFILKGDENIREPAILFEDVQREMQEILKELKGKKKIKHYTIIEGLVETTTQNIINAINELINPPPLAPS